MSQPNFEALISEHPESRDALLMLVKWLMSKARGDVITPRMLAREVPLDSKQLADALTLLVSAGLLRIVYKVTTPSGVLAEPEFDDPRQIPDTLPDRRERYFNTANSDVVPVFRRTA